MFSKETLKIVKRLQTARLSLMQKQPFYAVLLLHMQFSLDLSCETAYTDGTRIAFCPDFIESLSDTELEFVLMHEVLHAALNHSSRSLDAYDYDDFNEACDIVVNSNILYSCNMDKSAITLKNYGESMHLAPDGKEGYLYTAEEVYRLVRVKNALEKDKERRKDKNRSKQKCDDDSFPDQDGSEKSDSEKGGRNKEDGSEMPSRCDGGFDDHTYWGLDDGDSSSQGQEDGNAEDAGSDNGTLAAGNDYLNRKADAGEIKDDMRDRWLQRMIEATQITERIRIRKSGRGCGPTPLGVQRIVKELTEPQTDWRTVLDTFIQEEITDYSFNPPDRRFQDSPFLLPDYNEKDENVKDLLFMIDTSGSMSDYMITQAYSEIYGAIQQFNGKLHGWLGFFDAKVVEPKEFNDEEEFKIIRPEGGGGTSFKCIFDYVKEHNNEITPASIVILTDGYAPFPEEQEAMDIPVLWLINNDDVAPPWGKTTRIKVNEKGDSNG